MMFRMYEILTDGIEILCLHSGISHILFSYSRDQVEETLAHQLCKTDTGGRTMTLRKIYMGRI